MNTLYIVLYLLVFGVAPATASFACNVSYDESGAVHADRTFFNCAQGMQDPKFPITNVKDYQNENLTVSTQFVLNNLISIDEIENTVELDFYMRMFWRDKRWEVPDLWAQMADNVLVDGIDILPIVVQDDPLPMWLPDIEFTEIIEKNVPAASLKIKPGGEFFWSRHVVLKVLQPNFDLHDYPLDSQQIRLKFGSYSHSTAVINCAFKYPPVQYVVEPSDGELNFQKNPIWYHKEDSVSANIYVSDYTIDPEYPQYFQDLEVRLNIERQADGTMTRFALPILMLLVLAGLTFWASFDSRVDTTMTILLSVSALYVVIIGNIPQLGYLTTFDTWIFTMFITLVICVCGHQLVLVVQRKGDTWPMRTAMTRMVEMSGRVILIPFTMIMYWATFVLDPSTSMTAVFYTATLFLVFILFSREIGGVRKAIRIAINQVSAKIDLGKDHRLSKFELFMFNFFAFGVFSKSTKPYRARKKRRARAKLEVEMNSNTGKSDTAGIVVNEMHDFQDPQPTFREQAGDLVDSDDDSD